MSAKVVKIKTKVPAAPDHLCAYGKAHWQKIVPVLLERGLFTPERMPAIEALCSQAATVRQCEIGLQGEPTIITGGNGAPRAHPLIAAKTNAARNIVGLSKALGLIGSQAARPVDSDDPDKLSDLGLD